jgi:hypothetical protein
MTGRDREGLTDLFDAVVNKPIDPFDLCDRIVESSRRRAG